MPSRPTPAAGAGQSVEEEEEEEEEAGGSALLLWWGGPSTAGMTASLLFPVRRIVCQTGEAPEAFSDVVTVNVSREGKSRERYSYVVSRCLLDVSLVIPAPLKTRLQPSHPWLA